MDSTVVRVTTESFSVGVIKGKRAWTTINFKQLSHNKTKRSKKPQVKHRAEGVSKTEAIVENLKLFPAVEAWFNQLAKAAQMPLWKDRNTKGLREKALLIIVKAAIIDSNDPPFPVEEEVGDGSWSPATPETIAQLERSMVQIAYEYDDDDDDEVPNPANSDGGQPGNPAAHGSSGHKGDDDDGDDDEGLDPPGDNSKCAAASSEGTSSSTTTSPGGDGSHTSTETRMATASSEESTPDTSGRSGTSTANTKARTLNTPRTPGPPTAYGKSKVMTMKDLKKFSLKRERSEVIDLTDDHDDDKRIKSEYYEEGDDGRLTTSRRTPAQEARDKRRFLG